MTAATERALPVRVVFVVGATAVGKTELAAAIARAVNGEIIGADSRQVYRFMDIGTAKPTVALRAEIPHHMVDVVDPDESFDVARWRQGALEALRGVAGRSRAAIVCGGTGLYVRSLLGGLFSGPAADTEVRRRLERQERDRPGSLRERLCRVDPETAARLHPNDLLRTVRALEVFELSGRCLSAWHAEHRAHEAPFEALLLEAVLPREELHARIAERSHRMVAEGLLDEVEGLRRRGYDTDARAFQAIGYREAVACLDGRLAQEELTQAITVATRRYARRQLVWNRGQFDAEEIPAAAAVQAIARVAQFLSGAGAQD